MTRAREKRAAERARALKEIDDGWYIVVTHDQHQVVTVRERLQTVGENHPKLCANHLEAARLCRNVPTDGNGKLHIVPYVAACFAKGTKSVAEVVNIEDERGRKIQGFSRRSADGTVQSSETVPKPKQTQRGSRRR
jgi:hypothetical protein